MCSSDLGAEAKSPCFGGFASAPAIPKSPSNRARTQAADLDRIYGCPTCGPSGLRFAPISLRVPRILQEGQKVRRFDSSPRFQRATTKQAAGGSANPQMLVFCPSDLLVKEISFLRNGLDPLQRRGDSSARFGAEMR